LIWQTQNLFYRVLNSSKFVYKFRPVHTHTSTLHDVTKTCQCYLGAEKDRQLLCLMTLSVNFDMHL